MRSYILLLILLFAIVCQGKGQTENNLPEEENSEQTGDTLRAVISTKFPGTAYPLIFEAAYFPGTTVDQGDMHYHFEVADLGKIKIEGGKIIACDPIVMQDGVAFAQAFPNGQFDVQLAVAKSDSSEGTAFSRILFSNEAVVQWEFALQPGQKQIDLHDTTFYCYGVDGGTGLFIDRKANKIFSRKPISDWEDVFITKAEENNYTGYIYEFDGHNLATFSTGYGDGCYATYIGLDKNGNVCRLLTDFEIVAWWQPKN